MDSKVDILNETLLNIFWSYTPNKKNQCDYRQPPWMTNNIKRSLKESSKLTKRYYKNGQKKKDLENLQRNLPTVLKKFWKLKIIIFLKQTQNFKIQRLLQKRTKLFEQTIKKFKKRKQNKVNGKFVFDFSKKASLFNKVFVSVCISIKNSSILLLLF